MGIIDKCQMRGDAMLCVIIFKIHVLCCLFFITEWRMEHGKQRYQKSTNIYCKMSRSLQYMRKKWSEMLCVHCIEKPVGLFDQWFCMNICISFIGDCKSNCSRDMMKIYIYIYIYKYGCNIVLCYQYIYAPRSNYRGHIVFVLFLPSLELLNCTRKRLHTGNWLAYSLYL